MSNRKVFQNAKWIILCKIVQSVLQLVIGMISARYLGPSDYGLVNYAKSLTAFVIPLMQLGLTATLTRELIDHPEKEGQILGTALFMEQLSGLGCMLLVSGFAAVANPGEPRTVLVCVLYSISLLFQAMELMNYWFHSHLQSKYPSMAALAAYIVCSAYKIFLLATGKSVFWFALSYTIEWAVIGVCLTVILHGKMGQRLTVSWQTAKELFQRSRFYIVSSMMVTLFQNVDHIMLTNLVSETENGFYSAAVTCATVAQFVYAAIIDSTRPVILEAKQSDQRAYEKQMTMLYCITLYLSLAQAVVFTVFAKVIVYILYGMEYMPSVPVLQILVWYLGFSFMGSVRNIWILAEGRQKHLWKVNLVGAVVNILLNILLIPTLQAKGAAIALLATQIVANFLFGFVYPPLRENNRLLLRGLNPRLLLNFIKSWCRPSATHRPK